MAKHKLYYTVALVRYADMDVVEYHVGRHREKVIKLDALSRAMDARDAEAVEFFQRCIDEAPALVGDSAEFVISQSACRDKMDKCFFPAS